MTDEQWEELVRRIEPLARENPRGYARRLALLGALGYGYLAAALAVLVALGVVVFWLALEGPAVLLKLLIPLGAVAVVVLRSLFVKVDPPEGVRLEPRDAPELFEMLERVRRKARGPRVHRVLADGELNAAIVQVPRLGPLGWNRNYLLLGVPLMQALSPDEFQAVLAHELGHLSKAHGRFGVWVYRIRATWFQLLAALEERRSWGTALFRHFFEWYVPYFNAYSFVLMRAHEREADRIAAEAVGARPLAQALARLGVADRVLQTEHWPRVFQRTRDEESPPPGAFAAMASLLPAAAGHEAAASWLRQDLQAEADGADTHPSLAERLRELGVDPEGLLAPNGASETAAQRYLGGLEQRLVEQIERDWRSAVIDFWRQQHHEAQRARRTLEQLDEGAERGELTPDEQRTRASLVEEFRDQDAALAAWREVLERAPWDPPANFSVGRLLLARGDDAGISHLERAMDDPEAVLPGCGLAAEFLAERGREAEAEVFRRRAEQQLEQFQAAAEERQGVSVEDRFLPPELPREQLDVVRRAIMAAGDVAEAFLARKHVEHFADAYPYYVLVVVPAHAWRTAWREAGDDATPLPELVARRLGDVPVEIQIVALDRKSPLASRIADVRGARIYPR